MRRFTLRGASAGLEVKYWKVGPRCVAAIAPGRSRGQGIPTAAAERESLSNCAGRRFRCTAKNINKRSFGDDGLYLQRYAVLPFFPITPGKRRYVKLPPEDLKPPSLVSRRSLASAPATDWLSVSFRQPG